MQVVDPLSADWLSGHTEDTGAVREFCIRTGIHTSAQAALELAKRCFPSGASFVFGLRCEPEGGDEKVVLRVATPSTVDEALATYDKFVVQWLALANPQARQLTRLSYTTV
jgi:hypothetical protein